MTIPVERETTIRLAFDEEAVIRKVVLAALEAEQFPYEAEVDVLLTDNEAIREITVTNAGSTRRQMC